MYMYMYNSFYANEALHVSKFRFVKYEKKETRVIKSIYLILTKTNTWSQPVIVLDITFYYKTTGQTRRDLPNIVGL